MRNMVVLLLAVVGAAITMYMVYNFVNRAPIPTTPQKQTRVIEVPPTPPTSKILVATKDLIVGQFIREGDTQWQDWPDQSITPFYVVEQQKNFAETGQTKKKLAIEDFIGAVVRQPIAAGQPLTIGMVGRPGERGFLAAVLKPGMRGYSVSTSPINSVSGFILPGDHVDILWKSTNRRGEPFVQTLMSDVRVIAVNTLTRANANTAASSFTFELTPKKVHALHLAGGLGSFSFVLRSIAPDREKGEDGGESLLLADASERMTADQLLSQADLEAKSIFDRPPVEKTDFTLPDELYYDRGVKKPTPKPAPKNPKPVVRRVASQPKTPKTVRVTIVRGASGSTVKVRNEP